MANDNAGVQIPVIIDIDKACKDAAARFEQAAKPLQRQIDNNALNIKVQFGRGDDSYTKTIRQLQSEFKKGELSAVELSSAVEQVNDRLAKLALSGRTDSTKFKNLLQAKFLLEDMLAATERVRTGIDGMANSMNGLNARLQDSRIALQSSALDSPEWKQAAKDIRAITDEMAKWEQKMQTLGMKSGSIEKMRAEITAIEQKWNALSRTQRDGSAGQKVLQQYRQITAEIEKEGKSLSQIIAEEQKRAQLTQRGAQSRKFEQWSLQNLATTMAGLQRQAQTLQRIMDTTVPHSDRWNQAAAQLRVVNSEIDKLSVGHKKVKSSIDATNASMTKQSALWSQLTSMATMYVSVFGLIRFAKQIKDVTAELEFQRVALSHLIQDEEYGVHLFQQIKALAVESPFRIKDLVTYTKQLAAYRIETENLFDTTKRLADISAGLGVDMNRLILAYGQVRAAAVLRGQELRQFTEAGIPLVDLLAEKFSVLRGEMVSTADVFKLISERAVPFSMISEIFEDMTEKGGMFYEMQKTQADTLKGKWEKLKDAFDIGLQSIGETKTAQAEMDAILWILNRLAKNLQIIPKLLASGITAWIAWKVAVLAAGNATRVMATEEQRQIIAQKLNNVQLSKSVLVKLLGAKASRTLALAIQRETLATNAATRAWARLKIAFLTNPWGVAIAGITALISALTFYRTKTDEIAEDTQRFQSVLDDTAKAMREFNMTGRLIDQYERLASKTERTASENNLLRNTMERLADAFPDVKLGIDSENDSLSEQVRLLKEARDIKNEEARRKAEDELNLQTVNLEKYQKDLDKLVKIRDEYNTELQRQQKLLADAQQKIDSGQLVGEDFAITKREISDRTREIEYYRKKLNELGEEYDTASENVTKTTKKVESLNRLLNPEAATKGWDAWQKELQSMQKIVVNMQEYTLPSVTDDDIQGYESLHEALKKVEKAYKDSSSSAKEMSERLKDMSKANGVYSKEYMENLQKEYDLTQAQANGLKAILDAFGYILSGGNQSGSSYQKPKFITDMEEAIKFMKDFKKGYDDLRKYMGSEGALGKEAEIMLGRGLGLGLDAQQQKKAAENLSEWYQEMIDKTMAEMKKRGARGTTVTDLLGFDAGKNKALRDFQKLLQSLFDAKTDLDTTNWKNSLEKALNDLAEKVKHGEAAKKFYDSIFEMTGDKEMAMNMAISVYGDAGQDVAKNIQEQMSKAFVLDKGLIEDAGESYGDIALAVEKAISAGNYGELEKYLQFVAVQNRSTATAVVKDWQKTGEETAKNFAKLALKFDELEQQRVNITNKAAKERETVEKGLAQELIGINAYYNKKIDEAEDAAEIERLAKAKDAAIAEAKARADALKQGITNEEQYELSKLTREYRLFFSTVGVLSKESARRVYNETRKMLTDQFVHGQKTLAQYKRDLKELDEQMKKNNQSQNLFVSYLTGGVDGLVSKIKDYSEGLSGLVNTIGKNKEDGTAIFGEGDKDYIDKMGKIFGGKVFGVSGRKNVFDKLIAQTGGDAEKMKAALEGASQAIAAMGEGFAQGVAIADLWVQNIGNAVIELDKLANTGEEAAGWWNDFANVLMKIPTLGFSKSSDAGDRLAEMNEYAMQGFEKFKSGNFVGAFADTIRSWSVMFGPSVKAINREIKKQQNLLDELTYQYGRLDVAIDKAFGESYIYNYNKQLENLAAQQQAYLRQAELERSKGKKKDKDKIKEYEDAARSTADKIADMQSQLSEFFAGTDLTSAAEDFATAWIEAYQEFANTTDAMRDKFEDMIKSMVTRSLAAKLIQSILQPLFDQIDAMAKDGDLSAYEISEIARQAPEYVAKMNEAMTTMANDLSAAGYNLRGTTTNLTGISRDIAGASEESILGLSAAINTQNFYISRIPSIDEKMSQIIALMGGNVAQGGAPQAETPETDLKLQYLSYLPTMASDVNEILVNLKRVISPKGASTATHYIAMR